MRERMQTAKVIKVPGTNTSLIKQAAGEAKRERKRKGEREGEGRFERSDQKRRPITGEGELSK